MNSILRAPVFAACLLVAGSVRSQTAMHEPDGTQQANAAAVSEWRFSLRPYFFLSGISGSITAELVTVPVNSSFGDLLENLKVGGFVAFTAERRRWGLYTDFQYIQLVGVGSRADLELENLIVEADLTFRPSGTPSLRFLVGLRAYSLDSHLVFRSPPTFEANATVFDPVLGALGQWALCERWNFELRGDIGGFGASSEFTYQLTVLFDAGLSSSISVPFGYRILGYQIKTDDVWMDTQMEGMVLGLDIRF